MPLKTLLNLLKTNAMTHQTAMKVLHKNDFGYIAKCNCCNQLQLCLGNMIRTFTADEYAEFDLFFNEIRAYFSTEKNDKDPIRKYIIQTNLNGLILGFSYQELQDTIELLNFSNIMLSVNHLTTGLNEK